MAAIAPAHHPGAGFSGSVPGHEARFNTSPKKVGKAQTVIKGGSKSNKNQTGIGSQPLSLLRGDSSTDASFGPIMY